MSLPTSERANVPLAHADEIHPMHFLGAFEDLVKRFDLIAQRMTQPNKLWDMRALTIPQGQTVTTLFETLPDKYAIITPSGTVNISAYPSLGQPDGIHAFPLTGSQMMKLPGLTKELSIVNNGAATVTVTVIAMSGYDIDYDPQY